MICKKCGNNEIKRMCLIENSVHTGIYCKNCGSYIKRTTQDEIRLLNERYKEVITLGINDYQKKAHDTAEYPSATIGADCHLVDYVYPALGLAEEAGEVAGKFAKAVRDNHGIIDKTRKSEIIKELGDVCWFVAELCTVLDVNLESVMQLNLDKLASRKERGVIHGSGDNR